MWSKEAPRKSGWYYAKYVGHPVASDQWECVEIEEHNGKFYAFPGNAETETLADDLTYFEWWSIPIPPPTEVADAKSL